MKESQALTLCCYADGVKEISEAKDMNYFKEAADLFLRTWRKLVHGKQAVLHDQMLDDVLAEHADSLAGGNSSGFVQRYSAEPELVSLLSLAEQLHERLYPVTPTSGFQNRLLNDLMRQAHAQQVKGAPSLWKERRKELIIGATITSIISAAGVLAYLMHITPFNHRSHTSAS